VLARQLLSVNQVTVVNGRTGEVLTYRTAQPLLGKQYRLFNRHRQQQQQNALERHKNQARGVKKQPSESALGEHVDCLLAKSIVELAQTYKAASIVIPNLTNLRELLASEIKARAEQACPGIIQAQHQYAKQYQQRIHRWSYSRLLEATRSKAEQLGITIETGFQPKGIPQKEQARDLAIAAYHLRAIATT
jgi:transposase